MKALFISLEKVKSGISVRERQMETMEEDMKDFDTWTLLYLSLSSS